MQLTGAFHVRKRPTLAFGDEKYLARHCPFVVIPNQVTLVGAISLQKMAFQGVTTDIAVGGNFYIGLTNIVVEPLITTVLTDITVEPTSAGGYARLAATRDATGWPTQVTVNNVPLIRTKTLTFTASGADFDQAHNRLFLTDQASGTAGILFSISGKTAVDQNILDGESLDVFYQMGWR